MKDSRGDGCVVGTPSLLARDQLSEVNPVRQQGYAGVHASFCLASVFDAPRAQPGRPVPVPGGSVGVGGVGSPSAAASVGSHSAAGTGSSSTTFTGPFGQSSAATAARATSTTCRNEADPAVRRRVAAAQGRELAGAQLVRGQAGRCGGP